MPRHSDKDPAAAHDSAAPADAAHQTAHAHDARDAAKSRADASADDGSAVAAVSADDASAEGDESAEGDARAAAVARTRSGRRRGLRVWRHGLLAAAAVAVFGLYPLVALPFERGREWHGALPYVEADEHAYAAYVRALADGRPRRSDPYSGRDDRADAPLAESFFSIQIVPSRPLALAARALGLDASAAFALLTLCVALATALLVFRLLASATGDARLAGVGTLFVLCLSTVPTIYGPVQYLLGTTPIVLSYPPFLRRYVPAFPFPLLFAFYLLVWRALSPRDAEQRTSARDDDEPTRARDGGRRLITRAWSARVLAASLCFAALVYSYFFLWTAALAWLACLALLLCVLRPAGWRARAVTVGAITLLSAAALPPYFYLVARRDPGVDVSHHLTATRAPDPFRAPELLALCVLVALLWGARRRLFSPREDPRALLALSFALLPFAVLNQHVLTGRSLQPIHYELYVANFSALLALVLAASLFRRAWDAGPRLYARSLAAVWLAVVVWGAAGTVRHAGRMRGTFDLQDRLRPAALRLAELGRAAPNDDTSTPAALDTRSVVFAAGMSAADYLPTVAPQPVLWAPHMFVFPGVTLAEDHERLKRQLYFMGVRFDGADEHNLAALDTRRRVYLYGLVGNTRDNPNLRPDWRPITPAEIRAALDAYAHFVATFDRERAARPLLAYAVAPSDSSFDFSHLDRFYQRDPGERRGDFTLYRLTLKP